MSLLELTNVTVRFGGLTAVDSVNCRVDERQVYSVIGPNGAGKTTVFNAITGLYEPASGTVKFDNRPVERPRTARVVLGCLGAGLLAAVTCALVALDVEGLWRAVVKRPLTDATVGSGMQAGAAYWRGQLAVEQVRATRYAVVSPDGQTTIATGRTVAEARTLLAGLEQYLAAPPEHRSAVAATDGAGGALVVNDPSGGAQRTVLKLGTLAQARDVHGRANAVDVASAARRHRTLLAFALGLCVGTAGAYSVWSRTRRTPDVIARAGLARTFQNIRLFQNMTVLENVLTARDRWFKYGVLRAALRTPGMRREEAEQAARALDLLALVGLADRAQLLAKNLPYGDQRRLEIARALATEPRLILLDEPAAGMNPAESAEMTRLIERIRGRGVTVLLIEHHMRVVMGISDRIAVLDHGAKIAEGTPEEIRANPQVIEAYLGSEEVS